MNLAMGSHTFSNVSIPVLWGSRAILQDKGLRISVINLAGPVAVLEILGDHAAPGVRFAPTEGGFAILGPNNQELYVYLPSKKKLTQSSSRLPDCEIRPDEILVGTNRFIGNKVSGYGVGISISESGIGLGAPLPPGLASLVVAS
jgi:hypothetical protein